MKRVFFGLVAFVAMCSGTSAHQFEKGDLLIVHCGRARLRKVQRSARVTQQRQRSGPPDGRHV